MHCLDRERTDHNNVVIKSMVISYNQGAGHGIAGIIQVLLSCTQFLAEDNASADLLKKSVDYLLENCVQEQNMASNLEGALFASQRRKLLVHWCHGAAGTYICFTDCHIYHGPPSVLQILPNRPIND